MVAQLEVRVIFEISDPAILTRIGYTDDEMVLAELRELGLVNAQDEMTIFGLYAMEEAQRFEDERSKRRNEMREDKLSAAQEKKWNRAPREQMVLPHSWQAERQKWIAMMDNAPDEEMTREGMAKYCGVTYQTVSRWMVTQGRKGQKTCKPSDVILGYIEYRDMAERKREETRREIRLSRFEEAELAEVLAETGV